MQPVGQFVVLRVNNSMALDPYIKLLPLGVAHITQVKHVRNKISNNQGRTLNGIKVVFHTIYKELLIKEIIRSLW